MTTLGIALVFVSGFGYGWLLTWRYVSSLGWERR